MSRALARLLQRFRRSDTGLAAIEFALAAPFLCLLLLGGYDLSRFISIRAGVDKVSFSVADVTSQYEKLNAQTLREIFLATGSSLSSYVSGTNGVTVLTSLYLDASKKPRVRWQCYSSATSTWKSKIGVAGGIANVDASLLADGNDNLIAAEVYYKFKPVFSRFFKNSFDLYSTTVYRPRLGALNISPCQ